MNKLTKSLKKVKDIRKREVKNWEAWKKLHNNLPQRA